MKRSVPLKRAHRLINHGPVVLVTSRAGEGDPNVLAVAWVAPVCQDPPLAAVSIAKGHHSHSLIGESGEFVINVPEAALADRVMACGRLKGRDGDKFRRTGLTPVPAATVGPPLVAECAGHLECRMEASVDAGDHTVFIGRVTAALAEERLFDTVWKTGDGAFSGLHHLGGRTFAVSGTTLVVEE